MGPRRCERVSMRCSSILSRKRSVGRAIPPFPGRAQRPVPAVPSEAARTRAGPFSPAGRTKPAEAPAFRYKGIIHERGNTVNYRPDPPGFRAPAARPKRKGGAHGAPPPSSALAPPARGGGMRAGAAARRALRAYARSMSSTSTAFCACRRFSASSMISFTWDSMISSVISSPRCAGRQCCTMASGFAKRITASLTW